MKTLFLLGLFLATSAFSQSSGYSLTGTELVSRSTVSFSLSGTQTSSTSPVSSEVTTSTPASIGYQEPSYNFAVGIVPEASTTDVSIIQNAWTQQMPSGNNY